MNANFVVQDTGATIYQVTDDVLQKSNIYCEIPYCSSDSRYFVFIRENPEYDRNPSEYVIVELGTWETHIVGRGIRGIAGIAITHRGKFYFLREKDNEQKELVKIELANGNAEVVWEFHGNFKFRSLGTVSPDENYYAYGITVDDRYTLFGIELVDLRTGEYNIIDTDPYILNPHPQFEPSEGKHILVQHNRGGQIDEKGKLIRLVGEEGATLYVLDIIRGKRDTLQVGKPYTTPATGHEAWVGNTKSILLTVSASGDFAPEKGNLLSVRIGEPAKVVCKGYSLNHVGTSVCGNFFSCDDTRTKDIIIGSINTGKTFTLCHSETSYGRAQNTHPHPYLTPDLKWVVFNSDKTGQTQIYVAKVPDGVIEELQRET